MLARPQPAVVSAIRFCCCPAEHGGRLDRPQHAAAAGRSMTRRTDLFTCWKSRWLKSGAALRAARLTSGHDNVTQNAISLCICLACVVISAVGYWFYHEQNRSGVEVSIGGRSLTIETR
jgi:hypothetical protein